MATTAFSSTRRRARGLLLPLALLLSIAFGASFGLRSAAAATPPTANNGSITTAEDTSTSGILVASDVDGDPLTYSIVANGSQGVATITNAATGAYTYTPNANASGPDSFTFKANDGTVDSNVASVTVMINALDDAPVLTVADSSTYMENAAAGVVAATLTVTDADGGTIDAARVSITTNFVSAQDRLGIQGQGGTSGTISGFTWSYNTSTGVLSLSGNGTAATYQAALRQVTYSNLSDNPSTAARTIQFALGSSLANPANGHFYEYISSPTTNWSSARSAATARRYYGLQGYMVTVTSATEQAFVSGKLSGAQGWLGGSDSAVEGQWRWVTGPEAGTQFWQGAASGIAVGGQYTNWNGGEPNNSGGENYGQFVSSGRWNDLNGTSNLGYVVEYGGMPGDPTLQVTGNATVNITAANDGPVAVANSYSVAEDGVLNVAAPGVLSNDSDVESDPLTTQIVSATSNGSLTLNANGSFSYTPSANFCGSDSFTYQARDGALNSATTTVTITVTCANDAPTISNIADTSTSEDTTTGAISFTIGDVETAAGSLTVTGSSSNTTRVPNANIVFGGSGANRTVTVSPAANQNGTTTITVQVSDGTASASDSFVLTISAVNDAPVASNGSLTTTEDTPTSGILVATDVDSAGLTYSIVANGNQGVATITNAATGAYTYTPNANASGPDSFTFKANDGIVDSNLATISITITPVNDAPVLTAIGDQTVDEGSVLSFSAVATDVDVPADTLTYSLDAGAPAGAAINPTTGAFGWTPGELDGPGVYSITIRVTDYGTPVAEDFETIQVTVGEVNTAPVLTDTGTGPDLTAINEDDTASAGDTVDRLIGSVGVSISDVDNVAVKGIAIIAANGANGGWQFSTDGSTSWSPFPIVGGGSALLLAADGSGQNMIRFVPNADFNGATNVTFRAWDRTSGTYGGSADTTTNGGSSAFSAATDSAAITVATVNDAPSLDPLADMAVLESAPMQTVSLSGIGTGSVDESGQTLTVTAVSSNSALIANPTITYTSPDATGTLSFIPAAGLSGSATITVTVADSGSGAAPNANTFTRTFVVSVGSVNNRPIFDQPADLNILEDGGTQTINLTRISAGPADENGQTLTIRVVSSNLGLIANPTVTYSSPNAAGMLRFTPAADANGTATITVTVRDDGGTATGGIDFMERVFTIGVAPVNDAPSFTAGANQTATALSGPRTVTGWATGFTPGPADEASQTLLAYTVVSNSNPALFAVAPTVAADGTLTYMPAQGTGGTATIGVIVRDSGGTTNGGLDTSAVKTFTITIGSSYRAYLPFQRSIGTPDLVITSIGLSPNKTSLAAREPIEITVVVENRGNTAAGPFWVDLSINPDQSSTTANQPWNEHCALTPCYGLAWYVHELVPGASVTLTSKQLEAGYSIWPGWFAAGTTDLYAYADTYNPGVAVGAVAESDETNNQFHLGGLTVTGTNQALASIQSVTDLQQRPVRLR